nr:hypothetical protein [Actinomycetota bacterium]
LLRRTRLGLLDSRALAAPGAEAPRAVALALADELGWEEDRVEREVAAWREEAEAEGVADAGGDTAPPVGVSPSPEELAPAGALPPAPEQAPAR